MRLFTESFSSFVKFHGSIVPRIVLLEFDSFFLYVLEIIPRHIDLYHGATPVTFTGRTRLTILDW